MVARLKNLKKLIAASSTVAAVWASVASDGVIVDSELEQLAIAAIGLFVTWLVKNEEPADA